MRVVKIIKGVAGFLVVAFLVLVGVYFWVFGWSRGTQLLNLWVVRLDNAGRSDFYNFFVPHKEKATIDDVSRYVYVVVGVVVDKTDKAIGVLSTDGYRRYVEDKKDMSLFRYEQQCTGLSDDFEPVYDMTFGDWLRRVKRGDMIEVSYLEENKDENPTPFFLISYLESIPYGDTKEQSCLK